MRTKAPSDVPVYPVNIYTPDAIVDPYPHYARMREQGPVVWLSRHRLYALPRFAECKAVLRDDKSFVSGDGVALNPFTNRLSRGTTLTSDGVEHDQRRKLVAHRMLPRALRAISDNVDGLAADVVTAALERGEVDGVDDLASALPHAVVPDLVGWPRDKRDKLLRWGAATFDVLGPAEQASREVNPGVPADAAVRQTRGPRAQRDRGQHGPRASHRRGCGQAVARRVRAVDDRLHRTVA